MAPAVPKRDEGRCGMRRAALAGLIYFLAVFAVGFVLGAIRTIVAEPYFGRLPSVLVEMPIMLSVSWWVCCCVMRRTGVVGLQGAVLMGFVSFVLLMAAEASLSVLLFKRTFGSHLAMYAQWVELLGLAGQLIFALMPVVALRRGMPARIWTEKGEPARGQGPI
jgi:hypothetical protein